MSLPDSEPDKMIVDQIVDCDKTDTVFGKRWWSQRVDITDEDIAALKAGKYLAPDANGEYIIYLQFKA